MRILIGAPSAASLALYQPVIRALAERGHQLALVFTARSGPEAPAYERIKVDVPNVTLAGLLAPPRGMWADISQGLLGVSAYLSMLDRRKPGTLPRWLVQLGLRVLPAGTRPIARAARQARGLRTRLRRLAARLDRGIPASDESRHLLVQYAPDVVLALPDTDVVTAFESAASQADLVRGASSLGIPAAAIAGGPDGQLHATMLQTRPSTVVVSDEEQRAAVVGDLGLGGDAVLTSGAAWLDRALHERPLMSESEFRAALGLPLDRPYVFFCGAAGLLSDPRREMDLIRRWVASLRESADSVLRDLPVLIRPVRSLRWRTPDLAGLGPVVVCPRRYESSGELDLVLLAESVRYAAVVVGIDALTLSMTAAMGKRAVVFSSGGRSGDETPIAFLWTTQGSSVSWAPSLDELNRKLRVALDTPLARVDSPVSTAPTAAGHDGRASDIVADAVERLGRQTRRRRHASDGLGHIVMRVPLLLAAGAVSATDRLVRLVGR